MSPLVTFAWGFAGSAAVEVVTLLGFYCAASARLPLRYRRPGFWVTRLALALLGGALAVGYDIEQAILAFNIGAATPLIITSLARGFRSLGQGGDVEATRAPRREADPAPNDVRAARR